MVTAAWRFTISFVALTGAFAVYQLLAVPLIEPPSLSESKTIDPEEMGRGTPKRDLSAFFPPGSWQLDEPKVLETGKGMLLFRKFHRLDDERIQLTPCCLILFSQTDKRDDKSERRPIILRAPKGAILNTEAGTTVSGPNVTNIKGGRLIGDVVIEGPPSRPGAGDGIYMKTRTVQFSRDRIGARNPIEFRYGPHRGSGRDLTIYLSEESKVRRRVEQPLFASGVRKMELVHVDRVQLMMESDLLSRDTEPRQGTVRKPQAQSNQRKAMPAVVTCDGPFVFDLPTRTARFEDNVIVTIHRESGAPDQIVCPKFLAIEFGPADSAAKTDRKSDGKGRLPSKLQPQRIVCVGQPARLIARSAQADIAAEKITYLTKTGTVYLEDRQAVVVRRLDYRIRAPRVRYKVHKDSKRLGEMVATGPGELDGVRKSKKQSQRVTAKWAGELKIQRENGQPVLSLNGGAAATIEGLGQFSADNLFAWMTEIRKPAKATGTENTTPHQAGGASHQTPASPKLPLVKLPTDVSKTASSNSGFQLQIDRIAAVGRVEFDSPRLRGKTGKLEAWVRHEAERANPQASPQAGQTPRQAAAASNSPAKKLLSGSPDPKKPVKKYDLAGRTIQLQIQKIGRRQPDIVDVSIKGNVRIVEIGLPPTAGPPLTVSASTVQMSRATNGPGQPPSDYGALQIQGAPARVSIHGATVVGREIRLDQRTNRLWIDGRGEMFIPLKRPQTRNHSRNVNQPPMHLSWEGGMQFNGGRATIFNNVQAKGVHVLKQGGHSRYLLVGSKLDVTMDQFVDFRAAMDSKKRRSKIEPNNLIFTGGVYSQGEGYDEFGRRSSTDLMQVETLTLNTKSEALCATGPGWVSTVRLEGDSLSKFKTSPRPGNGQPRGRRPSKSQLIYIRVDFERGMEGNYGTKQVQFLDNVRTIYGPVARWDSAIDPNREGGLGQDDVLLKCSRLLVVQQAFQKSQWFEMTASGNAWIESEAFRAQAEKLTYSQLKDRLVLEGARDFAQLWLTRSMSANPDLVARKVTYWPRTNQVKSEDTRSILFHNFSSVLE